MYCEIEKLGNICLNSFKINYASCNGHESGIRRLGMINKDNIPAFPRMHNKFIICYDDNSDYYNHENIYVSDPESKYFNMSDNYQSDNKLNGVVLTGSYNYTENSNDSFENVVCIKDERIVCQYFKQFAELCTLSVPLDWNKEWTPHGGDICYGS